MDNKTASKAEFTIETIEGRIRDLAQALYTLAPYPDAKNHHGPSFISLNSSFKPAADYDGMAGSMLLESALGEAFSSAANDNAPLGAVSAFGLDTVAESINEYIEERRLAKKGKGSFALGEHKSICNHFNEEQDEYLGSYQKDFRERINIEETIAFLTKKLNFVKRDAHLDAYALCA